MQGACQQQESCLKLPPLCIRCWLKALFETTGGQQDCYNGQEACARSPSTPAQRVLTFSMAMSSVGL
jgi:hypothetical protein